MVQKNSITDYDCIVVFGPTAVGKSDYAVALAKEYNGEIINADSQQIYKGLDIGTAKISTTDMQGIPHHLLDFVDPVDNFSVAQYKSLCLYAIKDIRSRGKMPIIVGGTGFYIQSILYDMSYGDSAKNELSRHKYEQLLDSNGNEYLYNLLKDKDPIRASELHPNDTRRVIRALEILDNGSMPSMATKTKSEINAYIICLNMDRKVLYDRINKRVDIMINSGLEKEVEELLDSGVTFNDQCMKAIGYKEWIKYFDGTMTISQVSDLIKKNTRNYAKRQITWSRHNLEYNELIEL